MATHVPGVAPPIRTPPVLRRHPVPAAAADDEPGEQGEPVAGRPVGMPRLIRVEPLLIALVLRPADVGRQSITQPDSQLAGRQERAPRAGGAPRLLPLRINAPAAIRVGPGIVGWRSRWTIPRCGRCHSSVPRSGRTRRRIPNRTPRATSTRSTPWMLPSRSNSSRAAGRRLSAAVLDAPGPPPSGDAHPVRVGRRQPSGWAGAPERILVIDDDLGLSAASAVGRGGFERLLAEVALDHSSSGSRCRVWRGPTKTGISSSNSVRASGR